MAWVLLTSDYSDRIEIGMKLAQSNPQVAPFRKTEKGNAPLEAIYTVVHISVPEISEITLESKTFVPSTTTRKINELIEQGRWTEL